MYQKKGNHVHMRYWIHYLNTTQKEDLSGNQCICNQSIETMPSSQEMGDGRAKTNAYIKGGTLGKDGRPLDVGMDIFQRGLCLPSDNKMTPEQQDMIIEMIRSCFE